MKIRGLDRPNKIIYHTYMNIKCVVACINSNGEPDLYALKVQCTEDQYNFGDHYKRAREAADENGYDSSDIVFDEHDRVFISMFQENFIDWDTTSIYKITENC